MSTAFLSSLVVTRVHVSCKKKTAASLHKITIIYACVEVLGLNSLAASIISEYSSTLPKGNVSKV